MPLSPEQQENLYKMTAKGTPNWQVHRWLTGYCGLKFGEATDERLKAIKLFDANQYAQTSKKPKPDDITDEKERKEKTEAEIYCELTSAKEEEFMVVPATETEKHSYPKTKFVEKDNELDKESCITCGDPQSLCGCKVKTVNDIPF